MNNEAFLHTSPQDLSVVMFSEVLNEVLLLEMVLKKGLSYDDFCGHAVHCVVLGAAQCQGQGTRRTELFVSWLALLTPWHFAG